MANLPPNTFMNASNPQQNSNSGHTMVNHNQQNQIPLQHTVKQDPNSNIQNQVGHKNMNSNSGSNSPAFNRPPMPPTQGRPQMNSVPLHVSNQMPPQQRNMINMNYGLPPQANYSQAQQYGQINANAPPLIPSSQPYYNPPHMNGASQMKPPSSSPHPVPNMPPSSMSNIPPSGPPSHFPPRASPSLPGPPKPNGPYMPAQHSSMNGPSIGVPPGPSIGLSGHPSSISGPSTGFGVPPRSVPGGPHPERVKAGPPSSIPGPIVPSSGVLGPPRSSAGPPSSFKAPTNSISGPTSLPPMDVSRSSMPQSGFKPQANYGPNSVSGPPSGPISFAGSSSNVSGPPSGPVSFTGPPCVAGPPSGPVSFAGPPNSVSGPPSGPISFTTPPSSVAGPPTGPISFTGPPSGPVSFTGPPTSFAGPPNSVPGPPTGPASFTGPPRGPVNLPGTAGNSGPQSGINAPPTGYPGPAPPATHHNFSPYPNNYVGPSGPPRANQPLPPAASRPPGPASGPVNNQAKGSSQNRYPPMPQKPVNLDDDVPPLDMTRYPDNAQGLAQQMGQLSVTKQGFDQLWGHQMIDLLQNRHIYPPYVEEMQPVKLTHQFAESPNCSPEIFRSTLNRIPETNSLLQKSRLPLGILIHPFKDLNHLPVIQCLSIVRCRACRTYINPFVYFVDSKRWKCNLCFRVNDLPDEFQYDPVTKSYGDPSRRPEIKSATIEYIAPSEYMLRPPQPAVYLFLLDVSQLARESGYLQVFCDTLKSNLDQLPGDLRTQVGFICYDAHVHYYLMSCEFNQPKEMTVIDIDDIFLPSPTSLLVNLNENRNLINDLLTSLPKKYSSPGSPGSALGAALQAAHKLMSPTGGRITVFQTCLPNIGPGALTSREDPNARSSKEVQHLTPATDFYKRLALDCSAAQVAVDLFLLNSQYSDLATLSGMSKFSAGSVYHIPLFNGARTWQSAQLNKMLTRYLTRKIGFEAVMRVRCTRGISIHTFHGNFFVRSTDLLSLPNVSPDAGFGMQLSIEETLSDLQQVCFQAALLYTSSKGERRIRVHTMALPIATTLTDVLHNADQECIIGLLSKMAVDRCVSTSMSEAREAVMTVAVDALSAHRLAQNLPAGSVSNALHAPYSLRLLPLYLLALLKRRAFRIGTSTRLDDRVADMCEMKTLPLPQLLRAVYPDLYPIHQLDQHLPTNDTEVAQEENVAPCPPRLQLTAERISMNGAYLLDDGDMMMIYVGSSCTPAYLSETFGVAAHSQLPQESRTLVKINTPGNVLLHTFIDKINEDRPYPANILVIKDTSPSRTLFTERLVEDRVESAFSYYEFLQHIKTQVK